MTTSIIPGLYKLQVPIPNNPLGYTNTYLVADGADWTLIDAGFPSPVAYAGLVQELREVGVQLRQVRRIVFTHWHPDHFGLAYRIKEETGVRLVMHTADVDFLRTLAGRDGTFASDLAQWLAAQGAPVPPLSELRPPALNLRGRGPNMDVDQVLQGGEKLPIGEFCFEVIPTPGHTAGHVCLFEPRHRLLLSGDHVLPEITPHVASHMSSPPNPLRDFLTALDAVEHLDVDYVLPSHKNVFRGLSARVEEIRQHHEERCEAILSQIDSDWRTPYDVSTRIPWMGGTVPFARMSHFHQRMAVAETLAHLRLLHSEGRALQTEREDVSFWKGN